MTDSRSDATKGDHYSSTPSPGIFIRVEESEFTVEDYTNAAANLSNDLDIAVYPAGVPTIVNHLGTTILEFYFETADHQLTDELVKHLQDQFRQGNLEPLVVGEREVIDLEVAGSRSKKTKNNKNPKQRKAKKAKTKSSKADSGLS